MSRRRSLVLASIAATGVVVLLTALWARTGAPVGVYVDDGFYAILGRSLATGHGLSYLSWPGAPAPLHYPPGYPILLALLWRLGNSLEAVARWGLWLNAGCLAAAATAVAAVLVVRFHLASGVAAVAAILGAVATPVLAVTTLLLSEATFLLLLVLTLWAADRSGAEPRKIGRAVSAGALAGAATLVRTIGLAALIAIVGLCVLRRQWRAAAMALLGGLVVLVPWTVWSAARSHTGFGPLEASYGSYTGFYLDAIRDAGPGFVVAVVHRNLTAILGIAAALFAPLHRTWSGWVAAVGVGLAVLFGARPLWHKLPVAAVFLVCYGGVIVCWPYDPSRFLWAIWPLVIGALTLGVTEAVMLVRAKGRKWPWVAVLAIVIGFAGVGYARTTVQGLVKRRWEPSEAMGGVRALAIATWVAAHTRAEDVIATRFDPLVYLYSGRRAVPVAMVRASDYVRPADDTRGTVDLQNIVQYYRPAYVVLPGVAADLAPRVAALLRSSEVAVFPAADLVGGQAVLALRWTGPT